MAAIAGRVANAFLGPIIRNAIYRREQPWYVHRAVDLGVRGYLTGYRLNRVLPGGLRGTAAALAGSAATAATGSVLNKLAKKYPVPDPKMPRKLRGRPGATVSKGMADKREAARKQIRATLREKNMNAAKHGTNGAGTSYGAGGSGSHRAPPPVTPEELAVGQGATSGDVVYINRTLGRKPKRNITNLYKKIQSACDPCYYRWQGVLPYDAGQGFLFLNRIVAGVPPADSSSETMPVHIFNLSCIQGNNNNTAAVVNNAWRLKKEWKTALAASPQYIFEAINGQTNTGATTAICYAQESSNTGLKAISRDVLDYVDIRLDLVGPTNIPTKWSVEIVQYLDPTLEPEYTVLGAAATGDQLQRERQRIQYYDNVVQPWITHPILLTNPKTSGTMKSTVKTLHKMSFMTQPKLGDNNNDNGQERIIKIFKWLNKVQNYDWSETGKVPAVGALAAETMGFSVNTTGTNLLNDVAPGKRIYLIIKSQNQFVGSNGPTQCPTYDLVIRKKHTEDTN